MTNNANYHTRKPISNGPSREGGIRKTSTLDFLVHGMPTEVFVEFLLLHRFGLRLLVARGHVTGRRFALLARFRTF